MTAACLVVHPDSGEITFSGAGHPPLLIVRKSGKIEELSSGGPPVGIIARQECGEETTQLDAGEAILLYTDGLYSMTDETGARMSPKQAPGLLPSEAISAQDFLNDTINEVLRHSQGEPLPDDLAAVALRKL